MFSTIPSTGTSTRWNMASPLRASISARSCGVETITAPASGTCCAMVSCASPVPGGMSTTSTSSSPQATSRSIWVERRDHHRPAPDHRRLLLDEEADGHHLQAVALERHQDAAADRLGPSLQAEEPRQRRAVDVGVEDADLEADRLQPQREVDRRRRLADAALAGGDGDDRADAGDARLAAAAPRASGDPWAGGAGRGRGGRAPGRRSAVSATSASRDAGQVAQDLLRGLRATAPARARARPGR